MTKTCVQWSSRGNKNICANWFVFSEKHPEVVMFFPLPMTLNTKPSTLAPTECHVDSTNINDGRLVRSPRVERLVFACKTSWRFLKHIGPCELRKISLKYVLTNVLWRFERI